MLDACRLNAWPLVLVFKRAIVTSVDLRNFIRIGLETSMLQIAIELPFNSA